jgi:aspartate kinase
VAFFAGYYLERTMLVMKFGGASVKDADGLRNVARIVQSHLGPEGLVVVVSAMDKTTNELERLAQFATGNDGPATEAQLKRIQDFHYRIVNDVFGASAEGVRSEVAPYFAELARIVQGVLLLGEFPARIYDRIMAYGELVSSVILHHTLLHHGISARWADSRQIVRTDSSYKQAEVVWSVTQQNVEALVRPHLLPMSALVVQGYIASNTEGRTTTLGREGSDFTASIFGNLLGAQRVVIWKDVPAVMSADPRIDPEFAQPISQLSYESAVEMTFYGASVIHPKTIKPLQNLGIPLEVRSFKDMSLPGTRIGTYAAGAEPTLAPTLLHKRKQALVQVRPHDLSFVDELLLRRVFDAVQAAGLQVSLVQTSAISMQLVADDLPEALSDFVSALTDAFAVEVTHGLRLTSYLYPRDASAVVAQLDARRVVLLQQDTRHVHALLREE